MAYDQSFAQNLNNFVHGGAAPTLTSGRLVKLCSSTGTPTTPGTEITPGGGYTAGGVAITYTPSTAATPSVAGNAAVTISNMPAAATIAAIEILDTSPTPVRIEFGALSAAKSTSAGDTLSFSAGAITSALS